MRKKVIRVRKKRRVVRVRKKVMRVGMAGRNVTYSGNYRVNWGDSDNAYNRNSKGFKTRKAAIIYVRKLKKKYQPTHKVDYMYLAD